MGGGRTWWVGGGGRAGGSGCEEDGHNHNVKYEEYEEGIII